MSVYIKNLLGTIYSGPAVGILGISNLKPKGETGWMVDISSEIKNLDAADYLTMNSEQMAGKLQFAKDSNDLTATPGLEIRSTNEIYDTAMDARLATTTPASPAFFDAAGQTLRAIIVDGTDGAFEIDFFASIDGDNPDPVDKRYNYIGRFSRSDPGLHEVPEDIVTALGRYRWLKAEPIRGIKPPISFKSAF